MTDQEMTHYALERINELYDAGFTQENVAIKLYDGDQRQAALIRRQFIKEHGFIDPGDTILDSSEGEAFVPIDGRNQYLGGVLIRKLDERLTIHSLLHELSHVFCGVNEIDGGGFYGRFCLNNEDTQYDGYINSGYAIWREAIAEVMANSIYPIEQPENLGTKRMQMQIDNYKGHLKPAMPPGNNPTEKYALSNMIDVIMNTTDVRNGIQWEELEKKLKEHDTPYLGVVEAVFRKMTEGRNVDGVLIPNYKTTPEFIATLGETFIIEKSQALMKMLAMGRVG